MERESRRVFVAVALIFAAILALRFWPRLAARFQPKPLAAYVAIQPEGEEMARAGVHALEAGKPFRLHAVLEAETFGGGRVYFTGASRLSLRADEEVPADQLRRWPAEGRRARVRWWTVEGFAPYLAVASEADLARFRLDETFHAEWGSAWSVEGVVDPRNVQLDSGSPLRPLPFGTQRYQVHIEIYADEEAITPEAKVASAGAEAAVEGSVGSAVLASLPGPLARASRAFGLTQIDPAEGLSDGARSRIAGWHDAGIAFERTALLAEHLKAAGRDAGALAWETIDLAASPPAWSGEGGRAPGAATAGDLLQAGGRIVILFRDQGTGARLDPADLVFDLHRGAKIRRIDEVYREAGGLELEWAPLSP
jgi:hypothetical protein